MKKMLIIMVLLLLCVGAFAQTSKQEARKNLTVKEWNRGDAGKGPRFLDHVTKYDAKGRKIEDVEYTSSNTMKARCTYEYGDNGKVSREVVYNEHNKPVRIRKFEYNADGTKKKQYNYAPNGKLQSVKEFEYIR
ncbi:MAG: hypothetical protein IKQ75_08775 [Bacteroidales bacterium]|nr:hypothetical protein [Bacteroidales bacterium]MBR6161946.1 hypothetical protein [Bacteroidales bacterium]